jgi:hypothetical protein
MFEVELRFAEELRFFLAPAARASGIVRRSLSEKTGVKDVIEACGVPHTEVDLIVREGTAESAAGKVDLAWRVQGPVTLTVIAVPAPLALFPDAPRLQPRDATRFVADGHLGKLTRHLRLLGVDTAYERDADDRRLLEIMQAENRALLTRDRPLLMHSVVRLGYCPRSHDPEEQTLEVLQRFHLREAGALAPHTRCLRCNALLEPVPKSEVLSALAGEPLTLRYYEDFRRCAGCGRIYWAGSHFQKLAARLTRLLP